MKLFCFEIAVRQNPLASVSLTSRAELGICWRSWYIETPSIAYFTFGKIKQLIWSLLNDGICF